MTEAQKCELCGEPMPAGEEMFKFHGYSGNCPKPPLQKQPKSLTQDELDVARTSQAEYAERFFTPAMKLLAKIEAFHNGTGMLGTIPDEITELCNAYYGEVRPCL